MIFQGHLRSSEIKLIWKSGIFLCHVKIAWNDTEFEVKEKYAS